MRRLFAVLMFCGVSPIVLSQGTYTVSIFIDDIYWQNQNEWNGLFHAVLYFNGDSVQSDGLIHYWYTRHEGSQFQLYTAGGYGPSNHQDNEANQYYEVYVRIDVPGYGLVESDTAWLAKFGDPEAVQMLPVKEDGTPLSLLEVPVVHWTGYQWISSHNFMSDGELAKVRYNPSIGEKF